MREDLLAGATRVLEREGAARFNTNRVAEVTGVSIGSVYQLYPDKASLLVDLHDVEGERLWQALAAVLNDPTLPARTRFEHVVTAFFQTQAAATEHHRALRDAHAEAELSVGFAELRAQVETGLAAFFLATLPARAAEHDFLAKFTLTVLFGTGRAIGSDAMEPRDLAQMTEATTEMLVRYLGFPEP